MDSFPKLWFGWKCKMGKLDGQPHCISSENFIHHISCINFLLPTSWGLKEYLKQKNLDFHLCKIPWSLIHPFLQTGCWGFNSSWKLDFKSWGIRSVIPLSMLEVMSKCETPILLNIGELVWTNFFPLTMWFSISPPTNRRWMFNKTSFTKIDAFCRIRSIILLNAQFYKLKIDHKIRIGDTIVLFGRRSFLFCWSFFKDLYGKLGWRFVGRNDICFNLKIEDNV